MKKLTESAFLHTVKNLKERARPLERALYCYAFENESPEIVLTALAAFQNEDGGFGGGLEPDFQLPYSSPMATSISLRYLKQFEKLATAQQMIRKAVVYLENTFDEDRKGWFSVPKIVNDYPHAPWWTYRTDLKMTVIDLSWGNPTAELLGYLYHFGTVLDVKLLIEQALAYFMAKDTYESEHELYCYLALYSCLDTNLAVQLKPFLNRAVEKTVVTDAAKWTAYVPKPLKFAGFQMNEVFGVPENSIEASLDYEIAQLEKNNCILPTWAWGQYEDAWVLAKEAWCGELTLETLKILKWYGRLPDTMPGGVR